MNLRLVSFRKLLHVVVIVCGTALAHGADPFTFFIAGTNEVTGPIVTRDKFIGDASGLTNATPSLATNSTAPDGAALLKSGNRLRLTPVATNASPPLALQNQTVTLTNVALNELTTNTITGPLRVGGGGTQGQLMFWNVPDAAHSKTISVDDSGFHFNDGIFTGAGVDAAGWLRSSSGVGAPTFFGALTDASNATPALATNSAIAGDRWILVKTGNRLLLTNEFRGTDVIASNSVTSTVYYFAPGNLVTRVGRNNIRLDSDSDAKIGFRDMGSFRPLMNGALLFTPSDTATTNVFLSFYQIPSQFGLSANTCPSITGATSAAPRIVIRSLGTNPCDLQVTGTNFANIFVGNASGLTNGSPDLATNNAAAADGWLLSKSGNRLKLVQPQESAGFRTNYTHFFSVTNAEVTYTFNIPSGPGLFQVSIFAVTTNAGPEPGSANIFVRSDPPYGVRTLYGDTAADMNFGSGLASFSPVIVRVEPQGVFQLELYVNTVVGQSIAEGLFEFDVRQLR